MNLTWENVISVHNIKHFNAGCSLLDVGNWVKWNTNFEYFCFNGIVYKPYSGYTENTGYILDIEARTFIKKNN